MLMAEMSTAAKNHLPIKIFVLRNDALAEVVFERRDLGNPAYGCDLEGIDHAQVAGACDAQGSIAQRQGSSRRPSGRRCALPGRHCWKRASMRKNRHQCHTS